LLEAVSYSRKILSSTSLITEYLGAKRKIVGWAIIRNRGWTIFRDILFKKYDPTFETAFRMWNIICNEIPFVGRCILTIGAEVCPFIICKIPPIPNTITILGDRRFGYISPKCKTTPGE